MHPCPPASRMQHRRTSNHMQYTLQVPCAGRSCSMPASFETALTRTTYSIFLLVMSENVVSWKHSKTYVI